MKIFNGQYLMIAIFLTALVLRLIFTLQDNAMPSSDAVVYDTLGLSIAEGKGYADKNGTPHSHYPVFYPVFLSMVYKFFGHSYTAVKIIQSIIGAFTCVLIYLIGKRIWDAATGIAAGLISVIYPPFIKSAGLLLTELVFTFLLCLIVFYLLKIHDDMRLRNYIILGILLGITVLTKSITLFLPLFAIPVLFYSRESRFAVILKKCMAVFLFFSLTMAPWVIRNYNVYKAFIPTSANTGLNLYSSYCPKDGIFGRIASADDPVVVEANKIPSMILRNRFFTEKTVNFIINNPRKVLALEIEKILYLWAPFDWEIVGGRWFNFIYAIMLPFFTLGIFLALKDFRKNYIILLPIIYFQIMTLLFYGSPRFRLPIEPFLFILAISGVLECRRWILVKRYE